MSKEKQSIKEIFGEFFLELLLATFLLFYGSFTWGFITFKFFKWFINPVFPEVVSVGYWQAVGLSVFLILFKTHTTRTIKDEYLKDKTESTVNSILLPWVLLLCGWIIYIVIR